MILNSFCGHTFVASKVLMEDLTRVQMMFEKFSQINLQSLEFIVFESIQSNFNTKRGILVLLYRIRRI